VAVIVAAVLFTLNAAAGLTFSLKFTEIKSWLHDHGYQALNPYQRSRIVLNRVPEVLKYAVFPGFLATENQFVPELAIDVKFKHMEKLRDKRDEALQIGVLLKKPDDKVPATVRIGSTAVKAKVRLKGDIPDHLHGRKWSLRIETKGDTQILGMRRFSVQHPRTRGFHLQKLFNETARHLGVLTPRYQLVRVKLNGDDLGIMYFEEHFSKELLESQGRREGVIVRFDENARWQQRAVQRVAGRLDARFGLTSYNYNNVKIKPFAPSKVEKSERLSKDNEMAIGLLRAYVEGKLAASQVFDAEAMGKFLAVSELWGAQHGVFWNNMRFYFNPITTLLEPITFDANVQERVRAGQHILGERRFRQGERHFTLLLLDDPNIRMAYEATIRQLYQDIVVDGALLETLKKTQDEETRILLQEFYFLGTFDFGELIERATHLARLVGGGPDKGMDPKEFPIVAHANIIKENSGHYLEIANATPSRVRIDAISWVKEDNTLDTAFESASGLQLPITLAPLPVGRNLDFVKFKFKPPADMDKLRLVLDVELDSAGSKSQVFAEAYSAPFSGSPIPESGVEEQLSQHPFLGLREADQTLTVEPGTWAVEGFIVVPDGYELLVPAGTILEFEPDGGLVSRGPLTFQGTEAAPVVLRGRPEPGSTIDPNWRGLVVLDGGALSTWSHTKVLDTTGMRAGNWELTGGVTFYQSDVQMEQCLFDGHRGEDALNIVRSNFTLRDVHVKNTASDAFDADFSDGSIEGGLFENIGAAGGGDGVDVSGIRPCRSVSAVG
jgi:hypothetical protein